MFKPYFSPLLDYAQHLLTDLSSYLKKSKKESDPDKYFKVLNAVGKCLVLICTRRPCCVDQYKESGYQGF